MKDEKSVLVELDDVLNWWMNYFCRLLCVDRHGINCVTQAEIHTAKALVPEPIPLSLRLLLTGLKDIIANYCSNSGRNYSSRR
jgi:hypothetical protein